MLLFLENQCFQTPKRDPALRVPLQTPFHAFFVHTCVHQYI